MFLEGFPDLVHSIGEFGIVYKAHICGWQDELVAVKTLKGICMWTCIACAV